MQIYFFIYHLCNYIIINGEIKKKHKYIINYSLDKLKFRIVLTNGICLEKEIIKNYQNKTF